MVSRVLLKSFVLFLLLGSQPSFGNNHSFGTGPPDPYRSQRPGYQSSGYSMSDGGHYSQQQKNPNVTQPRGQLLQQVQIIDRNGFERPMVASTVSVPSGWRTEGGVLWNTQNMCGFGYNIDFKATSPDGMHQLHFYPMEYWQWNSGGIASQNGCPTARITSVRQYLEDLVKRARPGARILDYRERSDIAREFKQMEKTMPMPMGEIRTWVEAGEVLIGYNQGGTEMRETAASAVVFTLNRMQGMAGMPPSEFLNGATLPGFAMRSPDGQYDFNLAERIRSSGVPNREWTAKIAAHNSKMTKINVKGARDRSAIIAKTGDEIRQMQADSWKKSSKSFDYTSRESSEAIRGVETYNDPNTGGTVQLDSSYEHAWQLNNGQRVLTNDPNYNPNISTTTGGQRLEVTQ